MRPFRVAIGALTTRINLPAVQIDWRFQGVIMAVMLGMSAITAAWLPASPLNLHIESVLMGLPVRAIFPTIAVVYVYFRPEPRLAMAALAMSEVFLFTIPGPIFSYLNMATGHPFADDLLASGDSRLHFDWVAYTSFVNSHHWLFTALRWLYRSSVPQLCSLVLVLSFSGRFASLNRLVFNVMISAFITSIIGGMLPSLGTYNHYDIPDHGIAGFVAAIRAVHDGTLTTIDFGHLEGLVSFPSYHTALSAAFILAAWPHRYLRYPVLFWNVALIAGVPVHGAHYLVDIIAGAALAATVECAAYRLQRYCAAMPPLPHPRRSRPVAVARDLSPG
jgi:hypothetical protein